MGIAAILRTALFSVAPSGHMGLPLLFWGPPGATKTSIVRQVAESCGIYCTPRMTLIGSILAPEDVAGFPFPGEGEVRRLPLGGIADALGHKGPSLLFLDELNGAAKAVQKAFFRLVHEWVIGDEALGPNVRILAAANPEGSAAGYEIDPPLANRFGHIEFDLPDAGTFGAYLSTRRFVEKDETGKRRLKSRAAPLVLDPEEEEQRVLARWDETWSEKAPLYHGFFHAMPHRMHVALGEASEKTAKKRTRAFHTYRTWEYALAAEVGGQIHNLSEIDQDRLCAAYVGEGVWTEFKAWRKKNELPDIEALLAGKLKWKHNPERSDITVAVLTACFTYVTQTESRTKTHLDAFLKLLGLVAKTSPDLIYVPIILLHKHFGIAALKNDLYRALFGQIKTMVQEARISDEDARNILEA